MPKASMGFDGFNLYVRPVLGVSWLRIRSMEIDRDFVNYTEAEAAEDEDPMTVEELEDLASEDQVVGAKSFYTGSGFSAGFSVGLKLRSLGLGVHYAWAGIETNKGKEGDKKTGGYYKEYKYSADIQGAYGPQEYQQGTIKVKRLLFEMSYGLPFWRFELMFITRIGLALYPVDFFGFGINGFGGFFSFTGTYEGAYGIITGLTGFIVLQI
jgi:hypothetical protein